MPQMMRRSARINWDEVKSRLAQNQAALQQTSLDRSNLEEILRQRSRQLAQRKTTRHAADAGFRALIFEVNAERYALNLTELREVLVLTKLTPVPGGPKPLLGVVNAGGEIRSVLSLRRMLALVDQEGDESSDGYLVMLHHENSAVGLKVDRVTDIRFFSHDSLSLPAENEIEVLDQFVVGITPDHVVVLNAAAIRSHPVLQESALKKQ